MKPFVITPENLTVDDLAEVMRARTVAQLKLMDTIAGQHVDASRAVPVDEYDGPRILVYSDDRHFEWIGDTAPQFDTICKVVVVGYAYADKVEDAEAKGELLGKQILRLMNNVAWLAQPVKRIRAIDFKFDIKAVGEVYQAVPVIVFDVNWTEVFEPSLAPFSGTALPWQPGAPFNEAVLTVENQAGQTITGATITLSGTLSTASCGIISS